MTQKRAALVALIALTFLTAMRAQVVAVRQGTPIRVRLADSLSSSHSKNGDLVHFDVIDDLSSEGRVVIARGAQAVGIITDARGKRRMGRAGHIEFGVQYVTAVDNSHVSVSARNRVKGSNSAGVIGIGMALTLPTPLAPLFLLARGHDTEIPVGTTFTVYIAADAVVDLSGVPTPAPRLASSLSTPAPQSDFHEVRGETVSGPSEAPTSWTTSDQISLGDAARAARAEKARKAAQPQ